MLYRTFSLRPVVLAALILTAAVPLLQAQSAVPPGDLLLQAQQAVTSAEAAGAATQATSLFDDAKWRLGFAQQNWNNTKSSQRDQARMRALEAYWAARAASAKAQWLGTNATLRDLQADISRFGGTANSTLYDEAPAIAIHRGANSRERVESARAAYEQARINGGETIAADDMKTAKQNLETASKITKNSSQSESADHLAYVSEMIARRAYYLARAQDAQKQLPTLQYERTRLAQVDTEKRAAAERAQREEAERRAAELQQRLAQEAANRQAQADELARLRQQIDESRRQLADRMSQDRAARLEAERQLDSLMQQYETATTSGAPNDIDTLRRRIEDQQLALRTIDERERLGEQAMSAEIDRMRTELAGSRQRNEPADVIAAREADIARRQTELEAARREREDAITRRNESLQRHQAAVTAAAQRRREAEAAQEQLRAQAEAAQQQAQAAQQQAQAAQADAEKARQSAEAARQELEKTRLEMQARETAARRALMEAELAKVANTRKDTRGLIVTLPGIFFDTGKSALKPGAKKTLDRIAAQLQTDESSTFSVEGHTDDVGSEESNRKLSEARANAVRDYLVSKGIAAHHITASGFGEGQPIATNKTASGRQQNRRVELVIAQQQ